MFVMSWADWLAPSRIRDILNAHDPQIPIIVIIGHFVSELRCLTGDRVLERVA